jgi:hypothetical protein
MYPLIKIFSQLYVGFQPRTRRTEDIVDGESSFSPVKLAFVTPYENNAAGQKRIDTVERWAVTSGHWVPKADGSGQEYIREPKADEFKSVIIDNIPTAGFKLAEDIRRTGWNGGNVVWRIESPLGWEFEISSSNLARIITDCGIAAGGEILGRCIFGRMGKDNILIPEGSDLWAKSVKDAETLEARSKTVSTNDVVVGSICTMKNGDSMTYMGRFYVTMLCGNDYNELIRYTVSTITERELIFRNNRTFGVEEERYHVFKNNVKQVNYYHGKTLYTLYKEKKVVSVTGTDPDCTDQKKNETSLNSVESKINFASTSKNEYGVNSFVFSIDKPVSTGCVSTKLDTEYVRQLINPGRYSWSTLFTRMNTNDKYVGSDCTVFLDSGQIVDSMKLYGVWGGSSNGKNWGPDIKVVFDKNITLNDDGTIIEGTNNLDRRDLLVRDLLINVTTYSKICVSQDKPETLEIGKMAMDRLLENMGPFNLLTFTVTLQSGEILSSQVTC